MIKVSVIIPAYNVEKYIKRCIESLKVQTLKEIEYIIVNDGSTDQTVEQCEAVIQGDKRFHIIHTENIGAGQARNKGMALAQGEYIGFVDSDDYVDAQMFEKLYIASQEMDDIDLVMCSHMDCIKGIPYAYDMPLTEGVYEGEEKREHLLFPLIGGRKLAVHQIETLSAYVWRMLFKKEFISTHKIAYKCERQVRYEDLLFVMACMEKARKVKVLNECLYFYEHRAGSLVRHYQANMWEREKNLCEQIEKVIRPYLTIESVKERLKTKRLVGLLESIDHTVGAQTLKMRSKVIDDIREMIETNEIQRTIEESSLETTSIIHRKKLKAIKKKHYKKLYYLTYSICQIKKHRKDVL